MGKWESYNEKNIYLYNCVGACFMYRREVYKEIGGYNANRIYVEDYEYWFRILKRYGKIGHIPQNLYCYRIHEHRLSERKKAEIRKQLVTLRTEQIDWILMKVYDDKVFTYKMYYEFLSRMNKKEIEKIQKKILKVCPELKKDKKPQDKKKYIVYGAGNVGEQAVSHFRGNVKYFADNDKSKVHGIKCGIRIISFGELLKLWPKYNIMIAVGNEKIYEMMCSLLDNGIDEFCTYQMLIFEEKLNEEI